MARPPSRPRRPRGRPPRGAASPTLPALLTPLARPERPAADAADPAPPASGSDPLCLPQPDWLAHLLTVHGPAEDRHAFREAAAGAGVVPWQVDGRAVETRWLNLVLAVPAARRGISAAGAQWLASRLRDAWLTSHEAAVARVEYGRDCPLDLQALVPVPAEVLALGPDDPAALRWLWAHWGTTWPLRRVRLLHDSAGGRRSPAELLYAFSAADWSPWPALRRLRQDWPRLTFALRPEYG